MTRTEAYQALNMIPAIGPVRVRALLQRFGSPEAVLQARGADLREVPGLGRETVQNLLDWEKFADLDSEQKLAGDMGVSVIDCEAPEYPALLKEIHDPPLVLYVWGDLAGRDRHAVGVVGGRKPSHYGAQCAKKLSFQLAHAGLTVVSGLARGIDTAAHQAAVAAHGRTVAVIGAGLAELYPPENRPLAERITDGHGAVVSEFPLRTKPDRQTFPMRNRIISGWGASLLVVEAGANSGALITANQAGEQGRSIYAVPGPIDRPTCLGSNRLIQQGAKLVMDAADLLEDLEMLLPPSQSGDLEPSRPPVELSPEEDKVYAAMGEDETPIDHITEKSGLPSSTVSSTLLRLEMKRLVKSLPGKYFVKLL